MKKTHFFLLLPLVFVLLAFLILPFLSTLFFSFISDSGSFTLSYYGEFFKPLYRGALKTSFILSVGVTLIGSAIGTLLAYPVSRFDRKKQTLLLSIVTVPLTFSGLIIAYFFIIMLGSSGFVTLALAKVFPINPLEFSSFLYTWKGLLIAYLYFQIPRMIIIMATSWEKLDISLVEAARSLGAGRFTILFKVILPYLKAPLLAGSTLLFAISMGAFGTALALTGTGVNIFPLVIQRQFSDVSYNPRLANALVVILTLFTTLAITVYQKNFTKQRKA